MFRNTTHQEKHQEKGKLMKTRFTTAGKATSIVAVAAMLAMGMAGCSAREGTTSPAADPGITDTTITLGVNTPLSGPVAGPGSCALAGVQAYLYAANDDGGIKFGDGQTRKVTIKSYDDAYDPAKAVSNFRQMVSDKVFADVGGLGTGNNLAIMPIANQEKVPQLFLQSGSTSFSSDQKANPWTLGWLPTYHSEGESFGKFLAAANKPITVASIAQNDDVGEDYVAGLKDGIKGSQVTIVAETTYNVTDPTVDAQVTKLAATKADVFFSANVQVPLTVASLLKAQQLGWTPAVFLPSNTSAKATILDPGHADAYPAVYTTASAKSQADPQYANDPDVKDFINDMKKYSSDVTTTIVPQCAWGYAIGATLEATFKDMKAPTRQALMDAAHNLKDLSVPMLLPGITVNTTSPDRAPVDSAQVQKFSGTAYANAKSF
jgi:branched-chain amino acid transport system substrate-binding protein